MTARYRTLVAFLAIVVAGLFTSSPRPALAIAPLFDLQMQLAAASMRAPGRVGIEVEDLATGFSSGVNETGSMPAASTIKIPVMVEIFRQMSIGRVALAQKVHVLRSDRDCGSGDMCGDAVGTAHTVNELLSAMIDDSDNTATNMLIRLAGRQRINQTMRSLGLHSTLLRDDIRTYSEEIRYALRTSPRDMVTLLTGIAHDSLVDAWSSRAMLSILTEQHHNGLLPEPLPKSLDIAHKTGTLHDTLNDVGIVYQNNEPYVIAVMTTNLPSLSSGRRFIRHVSRLAYDSLEHFARWREASGYPQFLLDNPGGVDTTAPTAPDTRMWTGPPEAPVDTAPDAEPTAPAVPGPPAVEPGNGD